MNAMTAPSTALCYSTPSCAICQKPDELQYCQKCLGIFYCSKEHQTQDLREHNKLCGRVCINCKAEATIKCSKCSVARFCSKKCETENTFHNNLCNSNDRASNPQITGLSSASSSSSSTDDPLRRVCKETMKVWKQINRAMGIEDNFAPEYSEDWPNDKCGIWIASFSYRVSNLEKSKFDFTKAKLDLSGLELTRLPFCLADLPFQEIDLRNNKLEALPNSMYHPSWCGRLRLNSSTFGGDPNKVIEFHIRTLTNLKKAVKAPPDDLYHITSNKVVTCMQVGQYMVLGCYVFPIISDSQPYILIPATFNQQLIRKELSRCLMGIKVAKNANYDNIVERMKKTHPLAEAFFTGKAYGDPVELEKHG